jgi:hypothetical protein
MQPVDEVSSGEYSPLTRAGGEVSAVQAPVEFEIELRPPSEFIDEPRLVPIDGEPVPAITTPTPEDPIPVADPAEALRDQVVGPWSPMYTNGVETKLTFGDDYSYAMLTPEADGNLRADYGQYRITQDALALEQWDQDTNVVVGTEVTYAGNGRILMWGAYVPTNVQNDGLVGHWFRKEREYYISGAREATELMREDHLTLNEDGTYVLVIVTRRALDEPIEEIYEGEWQVKQDGILNLSDYPGWTPDLYYAPGVAIGDFVLAR